MVEPDRSEGPPPVDVARSAKESPQPGVSPYATGGGGVTFERKVAVNYLARLLTGDGASELGDGRRVVSVSFQQAPEHAVDDLVVSAAREGETEASLVLAIGVRRAPDLVQSDESTKKLISAFVRGVANAPTNGVEHRFALVVAGRQQHAEQLAVLADVAAHQIEASGFFDLVRTPNKYTADVRGRLDQVEALVKAAIIGLGIADPDDSLVQQHTWELLSQLTVLMPRLEAPDETDWANIVNSLVAVARGGDLDGAVRLRDRLVALASDYAPKAASIDLTLLRRGAHVALDATVRRQSQGWTALEHLNDRALSSAHDAIASSDGTRSVHIDRSVIAEGLLGLAKTGAAVVAHGDSGVGKSSLVLIAARNAATADPDATQTICIDLRHLPATTLELESILGSPLSALLTELSAPRRLLVIDGADAVAEGRLDHLRYLVDATHDAGVGVIAVSAADNKQVVRDALARRFGTEVTEYVISGLTDSQVDEVVAVFDELTNLAANARSRELLRRPVVIDLLVRGGVSGLPLSDADAMQQVWEGLVRRHERSDRGTPHAREIAMLRLADLNLSGGDPLAAVGAIDPTALEGLRQDGLLRRSIDDPFKIGPEFAHDEVRRYAVARLLLTSDLAARLEDAGVPRWALGGARLACQALLAAPDSPANPLHGRFARLQAAFQSLVDAGHGERWGDVPGEALLTMGDPEPVLGDAWPELRAGDGRGLQRLCRLVDQRLRDEVGLVRIHAVDPLISLLLDDETPWWSGEHVQDVLRDWLRALVVADTPPGEPLRARLRDRLVAACDAADVRLAEERAVAEAARAAQTPEEIEEERQFRERDRLLFREIGFGGRRRRERPEVPREITDQIVIELLALLGPDLGGDGEAILRRVAQDAPSWLAPAVEELLTGRALAGYGRGFLAELTEAYYLDEDGGSGFHEDGIRHHHGQSFGVTPLAAWYRGPFLAMFQSDFRSGVAVVNRLLNHAALARARNLADHGSFDRTINDSHLDAYRIELDVSGTRRVYVGDSHVWTWYRGTGVGPYPCMSALQALERVCDQLIEIDIPTATIVAILLDGCENLAMLGLVVGLLVRHLEKADRLLDPYLAEPMAWHEEFGRVVSETSGLAASSDGIVAPERRHWSLREAAMFLVVSADGQRSAELRAVGERLIAKARRRIEVALETGGSTEGTVEAGGIERQLVTVRAWASGLDRDTYRAEQTEGGLLIQSRPSDEIVQAMEAGNQEVERSQTATRLMVRYYIEPKRRQPESVDAEDLAADLAAARELLGTPPAISVGDPWDVPTAVAACALEAYLLRGEVLPDDLLQFAADAVLRVAVGEGSPRQFEFAETYFEQAADRSAARALPLLLLPAAASLRELVDGADGSTTYDRAVAGGGYLARAVAHEVRVHLARGLDHVWPVPCAKKGRCHHDIALGIAIDSMRDSAFGGWDAEAQRRRVVILRDPVENALAETADNDIYFSRLDSAIRALAPASMAGTCISARARELLNVFLAAHRRSLLSYDHDMDSRGTHALVAARALLTIASGNDVAPIFDHIEAFADSTRLLGSFLRALSAAAEEHPDRASTARRLWPDIIHRVIALHELGHAPFDGRYHGDYTLASLMPNAASEVAYLYREPHGDPIVWWDPPAWQPAVEKWLPLAAGHPTCVDHLISFLGALAPGDQVRLGLPWIAALVLPEPNRIASRTFLLSSWLIENRSAAVDAVALPEWQRVVDALVVAGASRLAPYSE